MRESRTATYTSLVRQSASVCVSVRAGAREASLAFRGRNILHFKSIWDSVSLADVTSWPIYANQSPPSKRTLSVRFSNLQLHVSRTNPRKVKMPSHNETILIKEKHARPHHVPTHLNRSWVFGFFLPLQRLQATL